MVEEDLVECIDFIESDVYNLPFEDETIDSITDHTLLINLDNPDRFIKEELRVLKKEEAFLHQLSYLIIIRHPELLIIPNLISC